MIFQKESYNSVVNQEVPSKLLLLWHLNSYYNAPQGSKSFSFKGPSEIRGNYFQARVTSLEKVTILLQQGTISVKHEKL